MKPLLKYFSLPILLLLLFSNPLFAHDSNVSNTAIGNGIGIGSALAIAICWTRTNSVFVSILAGIFGWLYVIYYLLVIRNTEEDTED